MDLEYRHKYLINPIKFKKTPKVIISNILSGSTIKKNEIINEGDILSYINNIKINTLNDIPIAIKNTVTKDSKCIIIKNQYNDTICLNIITGILETYNLSKEYNYEWNNDIIKILYKIFA